MSSPNNYEGKYHLPLPTGSYTVGCTDIMTGPDLDGCFFRLFYPTSLTNIYEHAPSWPTWIPHPKYIDGFTIVLGIMPLIGKRLVNWAFGTAHIPNIADAPPSTEKPFPAIIFSHGLTGCRTSYSVICSELASHGFVVAAIEHRDESACMSYTLAKEAGQEKLRENWIPYRLVEFEKNDKPLRLEQLLHRISECGRALDVLTALNEGKQPDHVIHSTLDFMAFKGTMDLSRPAIAGHSFGSATLIRTLAVDKRFRLGVALDAWMWPLKDELELPSQIEQPILFINMESFQNAKSLKVMKRFTDVTPSERRVVTLKGSVHKNQVDLPFLVPSYLKRLARAHSTIDAHLAMTLNNRLMLLFLWKHLDLPSNDDYATYIEAQCHWMYEGINLKS